MNLNTCKGTIHDNIQYWLRTYIYKILFKCHLGIQLLFNHPHIYQYIIYIIYQYIIYVYIHNTYVIDVLYNINIV